MQVTILLLLTTLLASTQAGRIHSSSVNIQLQRPRQFLMDVYTRPNRKGLVQHMRLEYERGIQGLREAACLQLVTCYFIQLLQNLVGTCSQNMLDL